MYCARLTKKAMSLAAWVAFHVTELNLRRKHVGLRPLRIIRLPVQHLLPSTGRRLWFIHLIKTLTSNLYIVLIRQSIRENNSINLQAQNTKLLFQPCVFLNGIWLLFMGNKQTDFLLRHHGQGHISFRESPTTWLYYVLRAICSSTVHHNACFSLPEHADWVYFSLNLHLCSLWAFTAWLKCLHTVNQLTQSRNFIWQL